MRIFDYDADVSRFLSLHEAQWHYVQTVPLLLITRGLTYLITASSFIMRRSTCEIASIALLLVHTENLTWLPCVSKLHC
jgi:hypothetical protein